MSGGGGGAARYVSVSELYSADEVALLLEEIRSLEPTACRGEELADCEIAGSGAARSPAPTERSWDSHAQYALQVCGGAVTVYLLSIYFSYNILCGE